MIFAVFAISLDYLWGKSGTPSFGHATFFGLGAYAMALVGVQTSLQSIIIGVVLVAAVWIDQIYRRRVSD